MSKRIHSMKEELLSVAIQHKSSRVLTRKELQIEVKKVIQNEDLYDGKYKRLLSVAKEIIIIDGN